MVEDSHKLLYSIDRNARYHARRRAFLDGMHRAILFVVILSGTAAFATFRQKIGLFGIPPEWFAVIPVFLATADLVFDLSNKSRDHEFLYRKYSTLLVDAVKSTEDEVQKWAAIKVRYHEVLQDEPPNFHVLNAACFNEIVDTYGLNQAQKIRIPRHVSWLMHIFRFENFRIS